MSQKRYPEEFKIEAVRQIVEWGHPVAEVSARLSVSRGDNYDNALAETINGLYKAELIHRRAP